MGLQAVVCGLIPAGGGPDFHPKDTRILESTDKVIIRISEPVATAEELLYRSEIEGCCHKPSWLVAFER
jgi:hypothetical protein